jgi:hypothetical protein
MGATGSPLTPRGPFRGTGGGRLFMGVFGGCWMSGRGGGRAGAHFPRTRCVDPALAADQGRFAVFWRLASLDKLSACQYI